MLWLCADFPRLGLDILTRNMPADDRPRALVEERQLMLCSPQCRQYGIQRGLSVSTAEAICAELQLLERQPAQEQLSLETLADCCLRFGPMVCLQPPHALLLEIAGSLRLFGNIETLLGQLRQTIAAQGFELSTALAPTPEAAWLLSGSTAGKQWQDYCDSDNGHIDRPRFLQRLGALPITTLGGSPRQQQQMQKTGFNCLADILSLPGASLGRRFGAAFLQRIERLQGLRADPRTPFQAPQHFNASLNFPDSLATIDMLRFPLRRLLQDLQRFLRRRQSWCQSFDWRLSCSDRQHHLLTVSCTSPGHDADTLLELTLLQLEKLRLSAAVESIRLDCREYAALTPHHDTLFNTLSRPAAATQQLPDRLLLDRLRTRLGTTRVHGISCQAAHLPEQAWRIRDILGGPTRSVSSQAPAGPRPLWLLPEPQSVTCREQRLFWRGELFLHKGPERIECGWWQGPARRDYFIARQASGSLYWVFRDADSGNWFLHGLFA